MGDSPPKKPALNAPAPAARRRRRRLRRALLWPSGLLAALVLYSLFEAHWLAVYTTEVTMPGLPPAFDGIRVVQLTDTHHSPWIPLRQVEKAVAMANGLSPDVIVLTGDYAHGGREYIAPCIRALGRLRAPMGVYAVLGNHDHWQDPYFTRSEVRGAGLGDLTNARVALQRNGQRL